MANKRSYDNICLVFRSACAETETATFAQIYTKNTSQFGGVAMLPILDNNGLINPVPPGETWQDVLHYAGRHFFQAATVKVSFDEVERTRPFEDLDENMRGRQKVVLVRSERDHALAAITNTRASKTGAEVVTMAAPSQDVA